MDAKVYPVRQLKQMVPSVLQVWQLVMLQRTQFDVSVFAQFPIGQESRHWLFEVK